MKRPKILYAITDEDVSNVGQEMNISFTEQDMAFIQDKVGDFLGSCWYDAVEYALQQLKKKIIDMT